MEELVFRGAMMNFFANTKKLPTVQVALVTSAIFTMMHFSPALIPVVFVVGLVLATLRLKTGSLQPCIAAHTTSNTMFVLLAYPR